LVIIFNIYVLCRTIYTIKMSDQRFKSQGKEDISMNLKMMRIACTCTCIMGLTWVFGALAFDYAAVVFQWLFTLFNSLQGLFIFIFHTFRNREIQREVQKWWHTKFYKINSAHQKPLKTSCDSNSSENQIPIKTLKSS